jgi:hypothetical protein
MTGPVEPVVVPPRLTDIASMAEIAKSPVEYECDRRLLDRCRPACELDPQNQMREYVENVRAIAEKRRSDQTI